MKHLTVGFFFPFFAFAGSRLGSMQRSLYIHLLSLLPWQGEEELCLQKAPPLQLRLAVAMETGRASEHDCTVRQTCRKGRRDVLTPLPISAQTPPLSTPHPTPPRLTHRRVRSLCCVRGSRRRHAQRKGGCDDTHERTHAHVHTQAKHRPSPTCLRCLFP